MKRILTAAIASLFLSVPVFAQDAPPTGIGYIPGMPVPQRQASPAPEAAPAPQNNSGGGPVARVSVAGQSQTPPPAAAQPASDNTASDVPQAADLEYKGVTPSKRLKPENEATFTKTADNQLSWIGFMPEEGAHRVFLQTSQPTTFERLATSQDRVEILLANTKLTVSNNMRELNMSYFQTPFAKAQAVRSGTGVKVIVQLKEAVPCEVTQHDNMIDITVKKQAQ